jgi:hypothetical protein
VLFGIGGGSGFGRFPYGPRVTLLTRLMTRETPKEAFLAGVCQRLGVPYRLRAASGAEPVRKILVRALGAAQVPVAWVQPEMPPWGGPAISYQAVAVLDLGSADATLFDGEERRLPIEALVAAAAAVPGGARFRTLVAEGPPGGGGTRVAVESGLAARARQMREGLDFGPAGTRSRFGLPGLDRWLEVVDQDEPRGEALAAQIQGRGGGPAMRDAQAAFLDQVGLSRGAEATREAAAAWGELAAALKDGRPAAGHVQSVRDAEARALDNQ